MVAGVPSRSFVFDAKTLFAEASALAFLNSASCLSLAIWYAMGVSTVTHHHCWPVGVNEVNFGSEHFRERICLCQHNSVEFLMFRILIVQY
jgi:hypothetical protein